MGVVEGVEGVEELFLGGFLPGDELDVVHQQQVRHPVFGPEVLGAAGADGRDQLVGELLAGHVHDDEVGVGPLDLDLDGGEQVGLAQARPAVDEQGIVSPRGVGRHRLGRREGELVGRALDKVLEGKFIIALGAGGVQVVLLGQDHFMGRGAGHNELNVHVKPKDRLESLFQQAQIPVGHDLADEIVPHRQGDMARVLKADRLQPVDVEAVGGLCHLAFAVELGGF